MNSKKTLIVVLSVLAVLSLSAPVTAQDSGAPDSVKLVLKTPPVNGTNVPVIVECSVYVDANALTTLQFAWDWDNSNLVMDSAKASAAFDAMEIGPFFYLDNILATTNDSQVAICSGTSIFTNYPAAAGWRYLATYYMHATTWSVTSHLEIDSTELASYASTEYIFLPPGGASYKPIWKGPIKFGASPKFLQVAPSSFVKIDAEGGGSPAADTVAVTETGGAAIAYNLTESISWLSLNKAGGTTPDKFAINYNTAGLVPGSYVDSIQVSSAAASNSPRWVKVDLTVTAVPKFLDVNPDTLKFTAQEGGSNPAAKKFAVTETGGFVIAYTLLESSSWLSLNKAGGNTPDSVTASINIASLTPATYFDSVRVSSGSANNTPIYEYIQLQITAAPKFLDVTPDTLSFTAQEGGSDPAPKNFGVTETGAGAISYTLSESTPWFDLNKSGGTTPDVVIVTPHVAGLTPATYYGNITVSSGQANNSPITETIKLVITAKPRILSASPTSFNFSIIDGAAPFSPATVHVTDSFNVGLTYTVGDGISWANIAPSSGTTPDSFKIIADTAAVEALPPGFYQDTVVITSGTASNSPVRVFVSLEISALPNNPPVIDAINDVTIYEGDLLEVSIHATDADEDIIHLFHGSLPANSSMSDLGGGNGTFTFNPSYNQAGVYPIIIYATDTKDTVSESFAVTVLDKQPGTEGDTLAVGSAPAVPGQQVVIPIDIANSCDVYGLVVPFEWQGGNFIKLDSIKFNNLLVGGISNKYVSIDNDAWTGQFGFSVGGGESPVPPGHELLANMYFSISPATPHGVYSVTPGLTVTLFSRNCGDNLEDIIPVIPGGGGNIIVDTTNVYVCGYVVDEEGAGIWGATVELWPNWPCEGPILSTTTNGAGAYAFTGFSLGSYDLYAYKRGVDSTTWNDAFYPNTVHVNFGENGIMIELHHVQHLTPVDKWVDYFCDLNTYFECQLPAGSIVEVWDPQNILCGRQFVRDAGVYRFMPVYRDSSGSVEDEGATTGDNLRFFFNGVQALTDGNVIYPADYDTVRVCLSAGERLTKECQLHENWNLVSWNLDTDTDDIGEVLSSLNGCLQIVLGFEGGGLTYVPGMDLFNTLTAVDHLSGYWIKLQNGCNSTLTIQGVPVEQDTPIPVRRGWNLVSYLPNDTHPIEDALYSLNGNLQIAYTYDGTHLIYVPGVNPILNTLHNMEPCFGYWLKLANNDVLTYPGLNGATPKIEWPISRAAQSDLYKNVEPTHNWVNMYSYNLTVDGQPVSLGSIVTAHNKDGNVIGYYEMKQTGTFGFMPVYADENTENVAGIKKGETFNLYVDGVKTNEQFTWTEQGALIEVASLTTGGEPSENLPDSYLLLQNYPNPFNPTTTISFSLPTASNAKLEIFNLLGQLVATPFDGMASAGDHQVVWDGNTLTGETASSGIYLYRLTADKYVKTLKMTLMK